MSTPQSPANIFKVDGSPDTGHHPVCYRHHGTRADTSCFTCLKSICRVCTMQDFEGAQCVECAARKRNARKARTLGLALSAVMASAVGISVVSRIEIPYDYGKHSREVRQLEDQLAQAPCDRRDILRLTELMLSEGNEPGVINRAQAFLAECKDWPRLRWVTYEAYKRSGQFDLAIAEATRLIDDGPEDKDFRWWRGMAYERKGDSVNAARDYTQAIALQPALTNIPFNLASMLEAAGRPCEAIRPVEQFISLHEDYQDDARVLGRARALHEKCPGMRGEGHAAILMGPEGEPRAQVRIGEQTLVMDVDKGSAYVVISVEKAKELGVVGLGLETLILASSHGALKGRIGTIPVVKVGEAEARNVEVAVVEKLPGKVDGLLGLSFLSRFEDAFDSVKCGKKQCTALVLDERDLE